ncbi:MAG: hypothetical protein DRP71_08325 [Verrucomicrobia bacterium]|nr:MAG: hypothetical protein DRP71_08325 [Verrucomicrobiota bacterium]
MRRIHYAILLGQILSYALIVTFIFADATFGLVDSFVGDEPSTLFNATTISACLIGMVGAASIWISFFYMRKSEAMRDWIVLCAWTQRVKSGSRWITITEFLSDTLGYNVTHGMSEEVVDQMRSELDSNWKKLPPPAEHTSESAPSSRWVPLGKNPRGLGVCRRRRPEKGRGQNTRSASGPR